MISHALKKKRVHSPEIRQALTERDSNQLWRKQRDRQGDGETRLSAPPVSHLAVLLRDASTTLHLNASFSMPTGSIRTILLFAAQWDPLIGSALQTWHVGRKVDGKNNENKYI